jgi:hypothetical protein
MVALISLSKDARSTAGVILLAIVAVEYGGTFMFRVVTGRFPRSSRNPSSEPVTPTQGCW